MNRHRGIFGTAALMFLMISGLCLAFFYVFNLADQLSGSGVFDPFGMFTSMDEEAASNTLGSVGEVIAAVLGVAITVVSIVLQLAANRYTPKVTDLFFRSPVNLGVITLFVVGAFQAIWVGFSVHDGFVPRWGVAVTLFFLSCSLVVMLPYFAYVFHFLRPDTIIRRFGSEIVRTLGKLRDTGSEARLTLCTDLVSSIEQLSEIALNAISNRDKTIAVRSIETLREIAVRWGAVKSSAPLSEEESRGLFERDPDLVSMPDEVISGLLRNNVWLEMKILRQFQMLFDNALGRLADVNYYIAMQTREIGIRASEVRDVALETLCIKFFNTYMRASINAGSIRTAYNVLFQYRLFGERLVEAGDADRVAEVVGYFKYYGILSFNRNIPFILETAAYDICAMLQKIREHEMEKESELLHIFLQVDREYEGEEKPYESSLRGVRKAQVKLAVFYLSREREDLARIVFDDMRNESRARLESIKQELDAVNHRYFWEIIDRGVNLDYIPPENREHLETFFRWFKDRRTEA